MIQLVTGIVVYIAFIMLLRYFLCSRAGCIYNLLHIQEK